MEKHSSAVGEGERAECMFLPLSSVDVLGVSREPVEQKEHVRAARHAVTNPGSFFQQTFLPHELPAADARVQILGLLIDQVGLGEKVRHTCTRGRRH